MENKFLGSGWAFPPEFQAGGAEVEMVAGEEDIRQSLQILLSTSLKERMMQSGFGCEMSGFLFEEAGQRLVHDMQHLVSNAILLHEPRIEVGEIQILDSGTEDGVIHISVAYTVRTTNNRFNLVYPFYLNEASV